MFINFYICYCYLMKYNRLNNISQISKYNNNKIYEVININNNNKTKIKIKKYKTLNIYRV